MTTTAPAATCEICSGRGQTAPGTRCAVCEGTGVTDPAKAAAHRELLAAAAVEGARRQARAQGAAAAAGWLREGAQVRTDAQQAAQSATQAAAEARAHAQAPLDAAAAAVARAEAAAARVEAAAAAIKQATALPAGAPAALAPDPTDPPPGAPIPPGFGAGDMFYFDSILVRQLDAWGSLNIVGGGGLMTNPMTTLGDLITGAAGGAPQRLGAGAAGQVLTIAGGVPTWQNSAAGFTNPMTTLGDLITGGAAGAAGRLGAGAAGQVLTMAGGVPTWQNSAAGFTNPMTTAGDLIRGGTAGAAQRLAAGGAAQVLTMAGGVPTWQNSASGFANPMTNSGDLIVGSIFGSASRLPEGNPGQVLGVATGGGGVQWVSLPMYVVPPSGDTSGVTDLANINAAIATFGANSGDIWLLNAPYYINGTVSLPWNVNLRGQGWSTVINYSGNASGIFVIDPSNPQSFPPGGKHNMPAGIYNLVIDGTNAGNNAILLDVQDMAGGYILQGLLIRNATGTFAIGWRCANNNYATNSITGRLDVINCTTCIEFTTLGPENSLEHIYLEKVGIELFGGQTGINLANGLEMQGCVWHLSMSQQPNSGPCIWHSNGGIFQGSDWNLRCELTSPATTAISIMFTGGGQWTDCRGVLYFANNILPSNIGNQGFHFDGEITGDANLTAAQVAPVYQGYGNASIRTPAVPASGTAITNNTNIGVLVYLSGGVLTAPTQINGTPMGATGQTVIYLPTNQTIMLLYSSTPTWQWVPIGG